MTINEIAKLAGVSRATVSRYLNQGYVSEEKRERIRNVIEETGYQPSSQARNLRTRKTRLIGVIIPKIDSHTISRMVGGISTVLAKRGYQLLLANTENNEQDELKYLKLFRENHVDGVILSGTIFTRKHLQVLKEYQVPVVILGQYLPGYSCVYQDEYQASKELALKMAASCRCLCFAGVTVQDEAVGRNRLEGFWDALKESGQILERSRAAEGVFEVESGMKAAEALLCANPKMDGLLCATDDIAVGAMLYLKGMGKRIPQDIRVAGFGDTQIARIIEPNLTTVHFYYKTSGEEAARMLLDLLETENPVYREMKMGYRIVERDSFREFGSEQTTLINKTCPQ
ncbi:MAG: LacI family transcriptional regulator [Lachnospiraceae bacterium]|jgi:LacI family sucrose operon transcriptional repressor|nr:LacI family transcriptional regulator [Lachnospiraceae bacterium]